MSALVARVAALVAELVEVDPGAPDAPLELDSFELVRLHDLLEQAFAIRIPARDLSRERFGSLARIVALVAGRLAAGGGR